MKILTAFQEQGVILWTNVDGPVATTSDLRVT